MKAAKNTTSHAISVRLVSPKHDDLLAKLNRIKAKHDIGDAAALRLALKKVRL